MSDMMLRGMGFPLVFVAMPLLLMAWRRHTRRRPVTRCPGPRRVVSLLNPVGWFWRNGCLYDLTALATDPAGRVRCPECARVVAPSRSIRTAYRFRAWRSGVVMLLVGTALCITPAVRTGRITAMLPTMALVVTEHIEAEPSPKLRKELHARLADDGVRSWEMRALIHARIDDLRDDDVELNALEAIGFLVGEGDRAVPALEAALRSDDWQQRQLAAHTLRRISTYTPGDDLFRVTLESLRCDDLPFGPGRSYMPVNNAQEASAYLRAHARAAEPHLIRGLVSDDAQQRVLCACTLAIAGRRHHLERVVPILIDHLRDNDIPNDARDAAEALSWADPSVVAMLEPYKDSPDKQQRRYVRRILGMHEYRAAQSRR